MAWLFSDRETVPAVEAIVEVAVREEQVVRKVSLHLQSVIRLLVDY